MCLDLSPPAKPNPLKKHGFIRIDSKGAPMFIRASSVRLVMTAGIGQAIVLAEGAPALGIEGMNAEQVASMIAEAMQ
jgi:hypothetical protein